MKTDEYESLAELISIGGKVMHSTNPKVWSSESKARQWIWDKMIYLKHNPKIASIGLGGFELSISKEDDFISFDLIRNIVTMFDTPELEKGEPEGYDWTECTRLDEGVGQ